MAEPTQGLPVPKTGQGDDPPQGITKEDVITIVNQAISARNKDVEKKVGSLLNEALTGFKTEIGDLLKPAGQEPAKPSAIQDDPIVKGLQKQLADLKAQSEQSKAEAEAERTKARNVSLRQRVADELVKHGVDASRARHAVGFLVDAEKRVSYQQGGDEIVFSDTDGEVDLMTGIKSWVNSEDGKLYLPPRGVNGSGDRGTGKSPKVSGTSKSSPENIGNLLLEAYG